MVDRKASLIEIENLHSKRFKKSFGIGWSRTKFFHLNVLFETVRAIKVTIVDRKESFDTISLIRRCKISFHCRS